MTDPASSGEQQSQQTAPAAAPPSRFQQLFVNAGNQQAFLKAGFLGWQGSGKTFTGAVKLGGGLIQVGRQRVQKWAERPMLFIDTETGSDWVRPKLEAMGIKLLASKTRSFAVLLEAMAFVENNGSMLIVDSVTHFWRDLCESYKQAKQKKYLEFDDWDEIKGDRAGWGKFMSWFINSSAHAILCGRAGHVYEEQERKDGKMRLVKTGTKMKAEGETGYEANLLVEMERLVVVGPEGQDITKHRATILKDRSDRIDGKFADDPEYDFFAPHVDFLNLGGQHVGVDPSTRTQGLFDDRLEGPEPWRVERKQKQIVLEEILEELSRQWPTTSNVDKAAKAAMVEELFGTRSWTAVEARELRDLRAARDLLWQKLRGKPYNPDNKGAAHDEGLKSMAGGLDLPAGL